MSTYDTLHRECRTLEALVDTKLTTYGRMAVASTSSSDLESGSSNERWHDLEGELDDLLEKACNGTC
jgi:golgi SNAP receptor complex member 1